MQIGSQKTAGAVEKVVYAARRLNGARRLETKFEMPSTDAA